jgi:hypothetical protein
MKLNEFKPTVKKPSEMWADRIRRIRSELISASFGVHNEETFLFKFLDCLHLLVQPGPREPLVFTLWKEEVCIFSSFRDLYYADPKWGLSENQLLLPAKEKLIKIFSELPFKLGVHRVQTNELAALSEIDSSSKIKEIQTKVLPICDDQTLERLYFLLRGKQKDLGPPLESISRYVDLLRDSLSRLKSLYPEKSFREDHCSVNTTEILRMLESLRHSLDDIFLELEGELNISVRSDMPLGNLFCVVRTVQSNRLRMNAFPYTANLLLSSSQRDRFREWCPNYCKGDLCQRTGSSIDKCLLSLEHPLSNNSRSAADVTFCTGIIDFGREPNDRIWDCVDLENSLERQRVAIETAIYPKEAGLYYVPVHVNGLPWLVLFTFTPIPKTEALEQERWEHNFLVYQTVTHKAVAFLRWRAEEAYLEELVSAAFGKSISWHLPQAQVLKQINDLWCAATKVFPFPRFRLEVFQTEGTSKVRYELPRIPGKSERWQIEIDQSESPFGNPQVQWAIIDPSILLQKLVGKMSAQILRWGDISRQESDRLIANVKHNIMTPIGDLIDAAKRLPESDNRNEVLLITHQLKELAEYSTAIVNPKRRQLLLASMLTASPDEFQKFVCKNIDEILRGLESKYTAKGLHDYLNTLSDLGKLSSNLIISLKSEKIKYHPVQVWTILRETIDNAIQRMTNSSMQLLLEIGCDSINDGIWLEISNSTAIAYDELVDAVEAANSGSSHLIGVSNIRMSCEAMEFPSPIWDVIPVTSVESTFTARVPLGHSQ